jgi:cytoskeleton protein RodZ
MTSIGETLRRERLKKDISLDRISQELKVSQRMLEAIESDDFSKLPGGVFARSFVRQYAHVVGLDEEEIVQAVRQLLEPAPDPIEAQRLAEPAAPLKTAARPIELPRLEEWQAVGDSRGRWFSSLRSLVLVVLVMVICSGVYTWWQHQRRPVVQAARETMRQAAAPIPPPVAAPVAPAPVVKADPAPAEAAPPVAAAVPVAADTTPESVPAETAPNTTVETPANPTDGNPAPLAASAVLRSADVVGDHGAVRVDLTAAEPVWILVRSDGKYVFSGVLSPNQSRTVEAASNVFLQVGNAGGVTIALNGKPIGSFGSRGEVRNLQLTSGGFQIVAARKSGDPLDPL